MNSKPVINDTLNGLLRHELTVINQYFLHARLFKHFGYDALGKVVYKQSIRAMKNADKLIERIYLLEDLPNLQDLGKLLVGEDVPEAISCDIKASYAQMADQRKAIKLLEQEQDYVSRALVESLLDDVEEYIDWLETQEDLIDSLGLENYLQQSVGDASGD
ncbi:bacterioferritin [Suttonella sp. R2A3]|uniref:bacterioferritin n=1 Tax=Suttonella sp. R2A3 TaxID=2908648 RepID=UPI001F3794BF|nr:bacterioferritin [Suttonella sp. R2A3]UJF24529.1 bacterioferritin [Suttonella sp. R2A3]